MGRGGEGWGGLVPELKTNTGERSLKDIRWAAGIPPSHPRSKSKTPNMGGAKQKNVGGGQRKAKHGGGGEQEESNTWREAGVLGGAPVEDKTNTGKKYEEYLHFVGMGMWHLDAMVLFSSLGALEFCKSSRNLHQVLRIFGLALLPSGQLGKQLNRPLVPSSLLTLSSTAKRVTWVWDVDEGPRELGVSAAPAHLHGHLSEGGSLKGVTQHHFWELNVKAQIDTLVWIGGFGGKELRFLKDTP